MERLFLAEEKSRLYESYTEEQIGDAPIMDMQEFRKNPLGYQETRYLFSTWGPPEFSEDELENYFPVLEAFFYAAGSIRHFCKPYFNRGVRMFSGWAGNAVPVAEFTAAQIILANKGYFQLHSRYRQEGQQKAQKYACGFRGNYGTKVGILGAGMIGKDVINLLKPYVLSILVFDPYLSEEEATKLNVEKAELETIFMECQTISNHLANLPATKGMLNYHLFSCMKNNATFINTGRGAQVVMEDLIRAMKEESGRTALLDVTDPEEPLPDGHEIWMIQNIYISPHRAGAYTGEILRIGELMMEEYDGLIRGGYLRYEITEKKMATMA